jgi:uncharacterized protein
MTEFDRRDFLRRAATGVASAALLGVAFDSKASTLEPSENLETKKSDLQKQNLITRTLGRTGIQIPIVSMGVMNADIPELVSESHKLGIRYFDTAWFYQGGNNERMIAKVIKQEALKRDDFILSTKVFTAEGTTGAAAKQSFLDRFAESMERLQLDYVDILFLHDVWAKEWPADPYIIEAFNELKEKKQIRFAGISTHVYWPEILRKTADDGYYDVAMISYNYSMDLDPQYREAAQYAVSKGMGLIAMKTQCQQAWYRDNLSADVKKFYEGKIMNTALLKWVMRNEFIATSVPGYTTFQQMEEDFAVASNIEYTDEEKKFLQDKNVRIALESNCHHCGKCVPTCPYNADLPNLMRTHMYAVSYKNPFAAKDTLRQIEKSKSIEGCSKCDVCKASCVRKVDIASRISELKSLYC